MFYYAVLAGEFLDCCFAWHELNEVVVFFEVFHCALFTGAYAHYFHLYLVIVCGPSVSDLTYGFSLMILSCWSRLARSRIWSLL